MNNMTANDHWEDYRGLISQIFQIIGYSADGISGFLASAARPNHPVERIPSPGTGEFGVVGWTDYGAMLCIVPSNWRKRYAILRDVILALQSRARRPCFDVDEDMPSHSMYYLGLLGSLGWELKAMQRMNAPHDVLDHLAKASLPGGCCDATLSAGRVEEVVHVLCEAYKSPEWDEHRYDEERRSWTKYMGTDGKELDTFFGVERQGRIIGVCQTAVTSDGPLIVELAVLPEAHRRGVGRYLLYRAMESAKTANTQGKPYRLSVDRDNLGAIALYAAMGYRRTQVITRGRWVRNRPS
jgi:ribosomal protein S18 acetylase RimI-like enzyme